MSIVETKHMMIFTVVLFALSLLALWAGKGSLLFQKMGFLLMTLVLFLGFFSLKAPVRPSVQDIVGHDLAVGRVLGQRIQANHPEGGTVAAIQVRPEDPDEVIQARPLAQLSGLSTGLGNGFDVVMVDATWVGYPRQNQPFGGRLRQTHHFKTLLAEAPDAVAVVSFIGVPEDIHQLAAAKLPPFYALVEDLLPAAWHSALPKGIAAVATIQPRTDRVPRKNVDPHVNLFEKFYVLTPESLQP
jgi:hypothetical protein